MFFFPLFRVSGFFFNGFVSFAGACVCCFVNGFCFLFSLCFLKYFF